MDPGFLSKQSPDTRCRICDRPVELETAKVDGEGKAIHEECYALKVKLEAASQDGRGHSTRPWKVIAAQISSEQNSVKMTELIKELDQALDEQNLNGSSKPRLDSKPKPDGK
jgi:hypothetical protein